MYKGSNFVNPSGGYPGDPFSSSADIIPVSSAFFGLHSETFGRLIYIYQFHTRLYNVYLKQFIFFCMVCTAAFLYLYKIQCILLYPILQFILPH